MIIFEFPMRGWAFWTIVCGLYTAALCAEDNEEIWKKIAKAATVVVKKCVAELDIKPNSADQTSKFLSCADKEVPPDGAKMPKDFFKAVLALGDEAYKPRNELLKKMKNVPAELERLVSKAYEHLPLPPPLSACKKLSGKELHEHILGLLGEVANNGNKKLKFGDLFESYTWVRDKKKPDKQYGGGTNNDAAIYRVKDGQDKEVILKVFSVCNNDEQPHDFKMHQLLYDYPFKEKDVPIPDNFKFVAKPLMLKSNSHKMKYIVMERFGATLLEWSDGNNEELKPRTEDVKRVLIRALAILTALHKAGFAHGDADVSNFAIARTKPNILYAFNFGQAAQLDGSTDWQPAVFDLFCWYSDAAQLVAAMEEIDPAFYNEFKKEPSGPNERFVALFQKYGWIREDHPTETYYIPFVDFKLTSRQQFEAHDLFKSFYKIAHDWLDTAGMKEHSFLSTTALTRWRVLPKPTL